MFVDIKDAPDKAKRIFDRLVDMFEEQNINPSPLNYYVWYEYLKGDKPQFRQEMDAILNDPYGYNDRTGRRLYDEYLSDEDEAKTEFDRAFKRLIDLMVKKMNAWSDKLESHTEELDRCSTELADPNLDPAKVKSITDTVLNAANTMKESSLAFQKEMQESSDEVRVLRQELIEARSEAMQDELTQVGNRKMFNHTLEEMISQVVNNGAPSFSLIIADIDHFKKFNDTYGHLVGDSVLRFFAKIMKKNIRDIDSVCRYGGEEFIILLPDTTLDVAASKAEEVRTLIENTNLKRKDENKPISKIRASFGVAIFDPKEDAESLIRRADKALYQAKDAGRNRVILETDLKQVSEA